MVIRKINDLSNAERFGTCAECGVNTDEAEIYRITTETKAGTQTYHNSICFCGSCLKKLRKELNGIDIK
jgi:hypothetical protein